jgi:hypothetical protein
MDTFEEDFSNLLKSSSVGTAVSSRIFWNAMPQNSPYPSIRMSIAAEPILYTYTDRVNLVQNRIQFDIFGSTFESASQVDRLLTDVLDMFKGVVGQTEFQGILFISRFTETEDVGVAAQRVYRISRDAFVNRKETSV